MTFAIEVVNFFLALVVVGMAYVEYKSTRDKMFLYLANSFAFFGVTHMAIILGVEQLIGELPVIMIRLFAYIVVIYGIYKQSRIYKIIK